MQHDRCELRFAPDGDPVPVNFFRCAHRLFVLQALKIVSRSVSLVLIVLVALGFAKALYDLDKTGLLADQLFGPAMTFISAVPIGAALRAIQGSRTKRAKQRFQNPRV